MVGSEFYTFLITAEWFYHDFFMDKGGFCLFYSFSFCPFSGTSGNKYRYDGKYKNCLSNAFHVFTLYNF